jgi:hypothetical protein
MTKEAVSTTVEQLRAAAEFFKPIPNNDLSPAGVARFELLIALSDAVLAIGDEMVRMGI